MKLKHWTIFHQVADGISNVFYFLPTIWKDRDWNQYYFHKIMVVKLKKMQKFYANPKMTMCEGAEKTLAEIEEAILLLSRILEEVYWLDEEISLEKVDRLVKADIDKFYGDLASRVSNWWD